MQITPFELARKLEAAREFDFEAGSIRFRFRVPSEIRFLELLGSIPADQARSTIKQAAVFVPACLVGWQGIRACDLDPDQDDSALPFAEELTDAVLERYPNAVIPAFLELMKRYQEKKTRQETEVKN